MKYRPLPSTVVAILLWSLACGTGKGGDSEVPPLQVDDTQADTDCSEAAKVTDIGISCAGSVCTWYVEVSQPVETVVMEADQTGDPQNPCGPAKGGQNDCGQWRETHNAFQEVGTVGTCGRRYEVELDVVESVGDQVDNDSTLFNALSELNQLTLLVQVSGKKGDACAVTGHQPSFFSDVCTDQI